MLYGESYSCGAFETYHPHPLLNQFTELFEQIHVGLFSGNFLSLYKPEKDFLSCARFLKIDEK